MKTTSFYALAACLVFSFTSCYKTYTCTCEKPNSYSSGPIKAVSKQRALKFCSKKNCVGGNASIE